MGERPPLGADEVDGLRTLELVFAAYESVCNGEEMDVEVWNTHSPNLNPRGAEERDEG